MNDNLKRNYRVVVLQWKVTKNKGIEIFSNLKILTTKYSQFNYNTLNNYLSKLKIPYETDKVRIERQYIISRSDDSTKEHTTHRKIAFVVNRNPLKSFDEKANDLEYWLNQPPEKRVAAVTALIQSSKKKNQRLDKTAVKKIYPK